MASFPLIKREWTASMIPSSTRWEIPSARDIRRRPPGGQPSQDLDARDVKVPALAVLLVRIRLGHPSLELDRRGHRRREVDLREEVVLHGSFRQRVTLEKVAAHCGPF